MNTITSEAQDQTDMARLKNGDDDALNTLMGRYGERLFHYFIRLLQNETEAADLAQETFVRVYQSRARFDPDRKFSTWIYAIATNLARDRLRWRSRHPEVSLDNNEAHESALKNTLPANQPTPRESMETKERAAAVRRAVGELPEELRVPLVLAEYEEQSHAEIAVALGCSPKAVEMRIYRARQQLRARLAPLLSPRA
jgi:RNA polymerase sigma-70 factor (ECF subfamily)